jgi:hypothetical protein
MIEHYLSSYFAESFCTLEECGLLQCVPAPTSVEISVIHRPPPRIREIYIYHEASRFIHSWPECAWIMIIY